MGTDSLSLSSPFANCFLGSNKDRCQRTNLSVLFPEKLNQQQKKSQFRTLEKQEERDFGTLSNENKEQSINIHKLFKNKLKGINYKYQR